LLGYLFYTYAGAAMAYYVNIFTLVYVALFSLSIFALVVVLTGLDVDALQHRFDACVPPAVGRGIFDYDRTGAGAT
jgi:hypothetical protein